MEHKNLIIERIKEEKKISEAISYHMANTEWDGRTSWGPWFLEEKKNALFHMSANGHGVLKPCYYYVPLERVLAVYGHGGDTIEDWSFQLHQKPPLFTFDDVLQAVNALCSLYKAGKCGEQATA